MGQRASMQLALSLVCARLPHKERQAQTPLHLVKLLLELCLEEDREQ